MVAVIDYEAGNLTSQLISWMQIRRAIFYCGLAALAVSFATLVGWPSNWRR